SYTLTAAADHSEGEVVDEITYTTTDQFGNTQTNTLMVTITDDVPVANPVVVETLTSGNTAEGNVKANDQLGADSRADDGAVVGVALGDSDGGEVTGNVGSAIEG
ncbi:hypothetical protein ACR80S_17160, partial [Halomonas sp. MA07-2]|uniref:hypothetical protein n=1 Tax=Halomonas sp. MA07-2 TaxID=3440841 RepID=UPI003EEC4749